MGDERARGSDRTAVPPSLLLFLFRDGDRLAAWLQDVLPFSRKRQRQAIQRFDEIVTGSIYGNAVVALVVGSVGGLAFFAVGFHLPFLWERQWECWSTCRFPACRWSGSRAPSTCFFSRPTSRQPFPAWPARSSFFSTMSSKTCWLSAG
ncbi:MAG: AI-2E family transporter [Nitrospira sp.]|nr:AI-2E family transporter [Nitrospira sp.]